MLFSADLLYHDHHFLCWENGIRLVEKIYPRRDGNGFPMDGNGYQLPGLGTSPLTRKGVYNMLKCTGHKYKKRINIMRNTNLGEWSMGIKKIWVCRASNIHW